MTISGLFRVREFPVILAVVLIGLIFMVVAPNFASGQNLHDIVGETVLLAVLAAAETPVILTRSIDVSVGATVGLSAYVTASMLASNALNGWFEPLVVALAIGAVLGLINGLVVVYGRVPSIIATLGTMSIFRGLLFVVAGGSQIYAYQIPHPVLGVYTANIFGFPVFGLIALLVLVPGSLMLRYVPFARELYAVGSNPPGAKAVGIPVGNRTITAFLICGTLSGLAGYLFISEFAFVTSTSATGIELQAIAAAVVGGVSLMGGVGTFGGAMLGALIMSVLPNGLALMNVNEFLKTVLQGALIIMATGFHMRITGHLSRLQAFRSQKQRPEGEVARGA